MASFSGSFCTLWKDQDGKGHGNIICRNYGIKLPCVWIAVVRKCIKTPIKDSAGRFPK